MEFEIVGPITAVETIASGRAIRQLRMLQAAYGRGHWRKLKGVARVRTSNAQVRRGEVHWYEAHGIGRVRYKIKRFVD